MVPGSTEWYSTLQVFSCRPWSFILCPRYGVQGNVYHAAWLTVHNHRIATPQRKHHGTSWNHSFSIFQPFSIILSRFSRASRVPGKPHGQPHGSFDGAADDDDRYEITLAGNWPTRAREDLNHGQGINMNQLCRF